jgi:hypothetical protein
MYPTFVVEDAFKGKIDCHVELQHVIIVKSPPVGTMLLCLLAKGRLGICARQYAGKSAKLETVLVTGTHCPLSRRPGSRAVLPSTLPAKKKSSGSLVREAPGGRYTLLLYVSVTESAVVHEPIPVPISAYASTAPIVGTESANGVIVVSSLTTIVRIGYARERRIGVTSAVRHVMAQSAKCVEVRTRRREAAKKVLRTPTGPCHARSDIQNTSAQVLGDVRAECSAETDTRARCIAVIAPWPCAKTVMRRLGRVEYAHGCESLFGPCTTADSSSHSRRIMNTSQTTRTQSEAG